MARCPSYPHEWNNIVAGGGVVPVLYLCDGELHFESKARSGSWVVDADDWKRWGWRCEICGEWYDLFVPRVWLDFDSILDL